MELFKAKNLIEMLDKDESATFYVKVENSESEDWKVRYDVMPIINKAVMDYLQNVALTKLRNNEDTYKYLKDLNQNIGLDPSMQLKKH
jgi:hypothetical protein